MSEKFQEPPIDAALKSHRLKAVPRPAPTPTPAPAPLPLFPPFPKNAASPKSTAGNPA